MESQTNLNIGSNVAPIGSPCILNLCSHMVEFYDGDELLVDKVALFLAAGLLNGEAAVAIVEKSRMKPLEEALKSKDINVASLVSEGRLPILDAEEILAKIVKGGVVDSVATQNVLQGILHPMKTRWGKIYAYGEMVSVLWGKGNARATLQLEREWNTVCDLFPLSLLCGYVMSAFNKERDKDVIEQIFSLHDRTHINYSP